jgi:hypothetical protein
MIWNYRVGTKLHKLSEDFVKNGGNEFDRTFSVVEVYYNEKGVPVAWGEGSLKNWSDYEDLEGTHKLMAEAFKKPILDLDKFPNEYKVTK